jgi:hypothetical protein
MPPEPLEYTTCTATNGGGDCAMNRKNASVESRIVLTVRSEVFNSFCLLTGGGFHVCIPSACTIRDLLCRELNVEEDYLRERIQTILLNSKVVDDPDTAVVTAGSQLALSAAMPGLVGATLRKGGYYAPMRSSISLDNSNNRDWAEGEGSVTVKLFNLLQQELGTVLLQRGIRISGERLAGLFRRRKETLRSAIVTVEVDGERLSVSAFLEMDWTNRNLLLRVELVGCC